MAAWVLKERLSFSGCVGIIQCILGSVIIVLYAPVSNTTKTVDEFFSYVLKPGFLVYSFLCGGILIYLIHFAAKKYGQQHPAVFISVVAIVGSYLVLSAQGFGSSLVHSISFRNENQFTNWAIYPLLAFVIACAVSQIIFLNKALNCFSPAVVAPINYVFFTTMTIISSAVLFQGFNVSSVTDGISMLIGFLVIVGGVSLLFQYSLNLNKLRLLSKVVEDIDDADDAQSIDENPIKILNEGISMARRETTKSETDLPQGTIVPSQALNESMESFQMRRHSLEPVSLRPKDQQDSQVVLPDTVVFSFDKRVPKALVPSITPIPEMLEKSVDKLTSNSALDVELRRFNTHSSSEKSFAGSSDVSKLLGSGSDDPVNQILKDNSLLELSAKFGSMEDSVSHIKDFSKDSSRGNKIQSEVKEDPTDQVLTIDLSNSNRPNEDWMW